jgi:hypothetical protein
MSVSAISSAPTPIAATASAKAADGDFKTRNVQSSLVKDSDGDYKSLAAASSAAAQSSNAVQTSLTALKKGG